MVKVATQLVQGTNGSEDDRSGAVVAPLHFSTAFRHPGLGESTGYDYSRMTTPTRDLLEAQLAKIEHGTQAFAVSSGMAAITLVLSTILKSHDHFITSDDLYGGSFRYFDTLRNQYDIAYETWNGQDIDELVLRIQPNTKAIWIETPSNPTMKVIDIQAVASVVHAIRPDILVIVDNTFLTPIYQNPLTEGTDIVVHSATKYLGGHNDILAGAVVVKDATLADALRTQLTTTGQVLDPFDSWLLIRSLKTLAVRMRVHTENAQLLAKRLATLAGVEKVLYAGVGGMISFYLAEAYDVNQFLQALTVGSFAESLGGVETLITVPFVQTHHDMPESQRLGLGITPQLIRLSVGLEDADDLWADLAQAIQKAGRV
ncbi:trans-sulfuration enzyme family protein [Weissella cibaria]|uniref:trans-sulfuration enzyme family protein n=1 Tax=Weissella cibaria TaxID=137591 RepID=UPI000EEBFD0C|nr:PLP-dependent aspartate aminotransferase family protein [Weissella cibaria]MBD1502668.1 PLP-dependent transferase [Weissella cibaria]MCG4287133.1 PLP-dependent aspartate aminotransferase family protein [Weissella cibaria]WCE25551.1 PLP-dependent aspartate aminotransferase family protein [Weissella cibaria]WCE27739.1 PLP-dependent aspartate aminotransferase family protein [Weissella cibaria]HCU10163.1 methionine biosynthesis PLP-dependent protein [Weissella cibaria]